MRRLPIFFVLDCSESMIGENLDKMKNGLKSIVADLKKNPHALETVYISIIAFAGQARTIAPLIDIISFYPPELPIGGGTSLGAALKELRTQIDLQVKKTSTEQKGDWKPIVYLLSDGRPTDHTQDEIDYWKTHYASKVNLIAIGLGSAADLTVLNELTDHILLFTDAKEGDFTQFMKWITASISAQSQHVNHDEVLLESYDNVISLAKHRLSTNYDDSCAILVGQCTNSRRPYLMKYERVDDIIYLREDDHKRYQLTGCYPVDQSYFDWSDNSSNSLQINTKQLIGSPSCPHCGNACAFAMCNCGHLICIDYTGEATCPWCDRYIRFNMGESSDFDVSRGKG